MVAPRHPSAGRPAPPVSEPSTARPNGPIRLLADVPAAERLTDRRAREQAVRLACLACGRPAEPPIAADRRRCATCGGTLLAESQI